jgi:hypothetical protein
MNLSKEYQQLLFTLFKTKLFNLESTVIEEDGILEEYVSKSVFIESCIEVLNLLGEEMNSDERINNEIDKRENFKMSAKTKEN